MKCSLLALSSYLDDELEPGRRAEIEAHLVGCERCRKGLECLREETERFGALGRVHVPDDAVSGFLQQLGLLGPGDTLPPRAPRPPDPPGPELPRWRGGGGAAETLPWSARHDPQPPPAPPESDQPSLPFVDVFSPSGVTVMGASTEQPPDDYELQLNGRSVPGSAAPLSPEAVPGAPEPPAPDHWSHGSVALEGVGAWSTVHPVRVTPSGLEAATSEATGFDVPTLRAAGDEPLAPKAAVVEATGIEAGASAATPEPVVIPEDILPPPPLAPSWPAPLAPPVHPPPPLLPPAGPLPASAPLRSQPPPTRLGDQTWLDSGSFAPRVRASDDEGDPWSWAPRDDPVPPQSRTHPAPDFSTDPLRSVPDGTGAPPGRSSGAEVASDGDVADADATPDPLIDPLIARVAEPPQPVRATLISRLRDQVSLRLALMRSADGDDGRTPGTVPGWGHGVSPPESAGLLTAALRARMDPPAEMDAPAAPPTSGGLPTRGGHDTEHPAATPWSAVPLFESAAIAEATTPRVRDLDRGPAKPGRHTRQLGDHRWIGPSAGKLDSASGRFGDVPDRLSRLARQFRRRYVVLAMLAILALLVVTVSLVVNHIGAPTPLPLAANTGASSRAAPLASGTPALQPVTALQPSASVAPSAAPTVSATPVPTPLPTPVPTAVVATQSFGSGGSGWTVEDVRYGTQPNGDLWIVLDFSGGSGEPKATASFSDPTTLDVTLTGAGESGLSPGTGGIVTKAVATSSGSTVKMVFDLSKAVTLKNGSYTPQDSSNPYPLHLILDLG